MNLESERIELQVIGFVHTVLKKVDLGLKTVLIVVPVNVLHNWRSEFHKWQPGNEAPVPVYMLEDVARSGFQYFIMYFECVLRWSLRKDAEYRSQLFSNLAF